VILFLFYMKISPNGSAGLSVRGTPPLRPNTLAGDGSKVTVNSPANRSAHVPPKNNLC